MASSIPPIICKLQTPLADKHEPVAYNEGSHENTDGSYPIVYQETKSLLNASMVHEHGWPSTTNTACHWCCHAFEGQPFGIPIARVDDKFKVIGNFCSLECASASNFDSSHGSDIGKCRNVYINELSALLGHGYQKVTPAPPRSTLKMFGGDSTIANFRNVTNTLKMMYPPGMIVEKQYVEEIDTHMVLKGSRFVPIDDEKLKRYKDTPEIKLKRKKPREGHMPSLDSILGM